MLLPSYERRPGIRTCGRGPGASKRLRTPRHAQVKKLPQENQQPRRPLARVENLQNQAVLGWNNRTHKHQPRCSAGISELIGHCLHDTARRMGAQDADITRIPRYRGGHTHGSAGGGSKGLWKRMRIFEECLNVEMFGMDWHPNHRPIRVRVRREGSSSTTSQKTREEVPMNQSQLERTRTRACTLRRRRRQSARARGKIQVFREVKGDPVSPRTSMGGV